MDIGGDDGVPQEGVDQDDVQPSGLNISDVIEAIRCADPAYSMADQAPSVRIVEQPASKALRFRYPCEGRSAGSIPGANSTSDNKTFPAIEITGHKGRAIVVVSCVNKDPPYLVHPHNLVGRENCRHGVYTVNVDISPESSVVTFNNLGIQCVKRKDIEEALKKREEMRVDPYRQGFKHREHPQTIDLNAVRLCFQVFLERDGRFRTPLRPCVSDVIYDKKAMSDLAITKLSHRTASVAGGQEVILLCEKVAKDDIGVTFTEMDGDRVVWSADCVDVYVHKQVAIHFRTPRYRDINVEDTVKVLAQLKRPSDDKRSDPVVFELKPLSEDPVELKRKRKQIHHNIQLPPEADMSRQTHHNLMNIQAEHHPMSIKLEPRERSSPQHMSSPPPAGYPLLYAEHQQQPQQHHQQQQYWNLQSPQVDFPNQMNPSTSGMGWGHQGNMPQTMISMHPVATPAPSLSPFGPSVSPNMAMGQMSPNMGHSTAAMGHVSPAMGQMSPNMGHAQAAMGHVSPVMGQMSPGMGQVSPHRDMMSPHIEPVMMQQHVAQQLPAMIPTSGGGDSFSGLLQDECYLSDSLMRLSTGDLLPRDAV